MVRLLALLRAKRYPNCATFSRMLRNADVYENMNIVCSTKTIYRDIHVLKNDFHAPIKFDASRNGYYLTNPSWKFASSDLNTIINCSDVQHKKETTSDHSISIFPSNAEVSHKQTVVSGINSRTGEKFDITCDIEIAPLIKKLNLMGIETLFSCQGGSGKSEKNKLPYLLFKIESSGQLASAVKELKAFWKGKIISVMLDDQGRINVTVFENRQQFLKTAATASMDSIGF